MLDEIDIGEILENTGLLSTDTRFLENKKYFICFKGDKHDAHDFLGELVSNEDLKYIFVETCKGIESEKLV